MMDRRQMLAMTAGMEGEATVVRNIGAKVKVSQMELICLCTFARFGLLALFGELDGDTGERARAEQQKLIDAIRVTFGNNSEHDNGLNRLSQSCVAVLSQERLGKYIVPVED